MGHKVNHSFEPNAMFSIHDDPRWGLIGSVLSLKPIKKGEELLVDYQYKGHEDMPGLEWYRELERKRLAPSDATVKEEL